MATCSRCGALIDFVKPKGSRKFVSVDAPPIVAAAIQADTKKSLEELQSELGETKVIKHEETCPNWRVSR